MRRTVVSLAIAGTLALAGCNLDLVNPNNPTPGGALQNPRAATSRMIVGVIATHRDQEAVRIRAFGSFGRETYFMFITDGRFITGPLRDWRQNNAFEAGVQWAGRYGNYRNAYEALKIIDATSALTDAEKSSARGVLKTFIALEMLHAAEARGAIGIVVDMTDDANAVNPIVSQDSAYAWISAKLDEANADLASSISADTTPTFYFPLHTGFSAFGVPANTKAGFQQFNRAIKARVEVDRGSLGCGATCYNAALTALTGTWIATLTPANRNNGIYMVYSTAAGDALNTISLTGTSDLYTNPAIDSISGALADDRYLRKTAAAAARSEAGASSARRPSLYPTNVSPTAVIRNEELILLRAEAEWFTGATVAANADLANVRLTSGSDNGHTSVAKFPAAAVDSQFVQELLLQRTFSLYDEGFRWIDYRRFGLLPSLLTPQDASASPTPFTVATASVLPNQECDARSRVGAPTPMSCPGGAPAP